MNITNDMTKEERKYIAIKEHNKEVVKKAKEIGEEMEQREQNTQHPIKTCAMINNTKDFIKYLEELPEKESNDIRYLMFFEVYQD